MSVRPHIERAIGLLGSQTKLADAVGCSQQNISNILRSKSVTAEMAIAIDRATNGAVSRVDLRPDIFDHTSGHVPATPSRQPRQPKRKAGVA